MEQDKEKEERNSASVRIETAELVNGDMGDGSAEQSDDHSPPHTDRTGREIHTKNEDSGTESEHRNGEGSTDQKVRACLLCYLHPLCHVFKAVSFLCSLRYFQISDLQHWFTLWALSEIKSSNSAMGYSNNVGVELQECVRVSQRGCYLQRPSRCPTLEQLSLCLSELPCWWLRIINISGSDQSLSSPLHKTTTVSLASKRNNWYLNWCCGLDRELCQVETYRWWWTWVFFFWTWVRSLVKSSQSSRLISFRIRLFSLFVELSWVLLFVSAGRK